MKTLEHLHMPDHAKPFLESILANRVEWNDSDLAKAYNLARAQADIERISREIEVEGDTLVNEKGTQIVNPKHALLETLTRREIALSKIVHVHAEATLGRARDSLGAKGRKEQAAKQAASKFAQFGAPLKSVK